MKDPEFVLFCFVLLRLVVDVRIDQLGIQQFPVNERFTVLSSRVRRNHLYLSWGKNFKVHVSSVILFYFMFYKIHEVLSDTKRKDSQTITVLIMISFKRSSVAHCSKNLFLYL